MQVADPSPHAPGSIPPTAATAVPAKKRNWLVSPWFDLLFIANLTWPIWFLSSMTWPSFNEPAHFVQVYLLSSPHRFITLPLVFMDKKHFASDPKRFGGIGLILLTFALMLLALGEWAPRDGNVLVYLMMVDYVWNSWHFAAQHAGVSRIYGRMVRPDDDIDTIKYEKMAIRSFVLWVFLRVAFATGVAKGYAVLDISWIGWLDPIPFIPILFLLKKEIELYRPEAFGRLIYMLSVVGVYSAILIAIHTGRTGTSIFMAHAVFHAVEYIAIVGWSAKKKKGGVWGYVAPRAAFFVLAFVMFVGFLNYGIAAESMFAWTFMTLAVGYLHYAYDGMIWKAPKMAVAKSG